MKSLIKICLLLLPFFANGQDVAILDSTLNNKWVTLDKWRYQKGDNKEWANPAVDDFSWKQFTFYNLNMPDGKNAIANRGEIVWFRKHIKADSSINDAIVLNIYQLGASEIYLDGKLIHRLGTVSTDAQQIDFYNPRYKIFQLPLQKGKEQVLAVRYVNAQYKFPIYTNTNGLIRIAVSTLSNANSSDVIKNNRIADNQQFEKNYHIALGLIILMFIIFMSFYLFFPNEKINGYFAIANLLLILFCSGVIWGLGYPGDVFWSIFLYDTNMVFSSLILVYCFYRVVEHPIDLVYKAITFLGIIAIGCFFLYNPDTVAQTWILTVYVAIIRIAVQSWRRNRVASILFLNSSIVGMLYLTIIVLFAIGVTQINIVRYMPFAVMLNPVVLAIYLGYAFGKRSQELRLNLERVHKLSKEKESILYSQNEMLEKKVEERTSELNHSIENLKATQAQLIQSEKMASLGELTAGIAHEIQNPLNFVNNFSDVSNELIKEMKEEFKKGDVEEGFAIADDIEQNLEKINHHGKRASDIVKGMLEHSRTSTGQKEPTDINALCDEYLRLAYHGLKAKDNNFNATIETHFDPNRPKIDIIPQDIGRVLLNLINNAFYAVNERANLLNLAKQSGDANLTDLAYKPTVSVTTQITDNSQLLIIIKDNGLGIPAHIKDKIFQPFFTTKPTGQGTGLGLSLSYDIVKAHGGELKVESKEGEETTFTIKLPIQHI